MDAHTADVQAGCVFQRLNDTLAKDALLFGPDPSSGNRATIGGIIANNATGAHSIRYGYAGDHLRWVDAVLADATAARFHADGRVEASEPSALREQIIQRVPKLLADWAERIEQHWPKTPRNRAGYGVRNVLLDGGQVNWPKLLAGSEGTLAIFTAARLTLNPAPPVKALVQVNFESMLAMAKALPAILRAGCSACELMDDTLLDMARQAHGGPHKHLPDVPASLVVEFDGLSLDQVQPKLARMTELARTLEGVVGQPTPILDKAEQAEVWGVRKKAVPLLFRRRNAPSRCRSSRT